MLECLFGNSTNQLKYQSTNLPYITAKIVIISSDTSTETALMKLRVLKK